MAVAPDGTLYFADAGNSRVRAILPNGTITTIAGNGQAATGPAGTPTIAGTPSDTAIGPLKPSPSDRTVLSTSPHRSPCWN